MRRPAQMPECFRCAYITHNSVRTSWSEKLSAHIMSETNPKQQIAIVAGPLGNKSCVTKIFRTKLPRQKAVGEVARRDKRTRPKGAEGEGTGPRASMAISTGQLPCSKKKVLRPKSVDNLNEKSFAWESPN